MGLTKDLGLKWLKSPFATSKPTVCSRCPQNRYKDNQTLFHRNSNSKSVDLDWTCLRKCVIRLSLEIETTETGRSEPQATYVAGSAIISRALVALENDAEIFQMLNSLQDFCSAPETASYCAGARND